MLFLSESKLRRAEFANHIEALPLPAGHGLDELRWALHKYAGHPRPDKAVDESASYAEYMRQQRKQFTGSDDAGLSESELARIEEAEKGRKVKRK